MNRNLLIDGIVRQSMIVIAQLATTGGVRAPLSHLASEVFMGLAKELEAQGLGRKVIADMFGLTLRAYHGKVRRLSESRTVRGKSLWTAILEFIAGKPSVTRHEVAKRFSRDDPQSVGGILTDLVRSGLLFQSGDGASMVYRIATTSDLSSGHDLENIEAIVCVEIHRQGAMTRSELVACMPMLSEDELRRALLNLEEGGQVRRIVKDGEERYDCPELVIAWERSEGWEAAVLDHFQTVATTIAAKAQSSPRTAKKSDLIGGSTFHFDLCSDHPLESEVLSLFQAYREQASELRMRVDEATKSQGCSVAYRVSLYIGQVVIDDREVAEDEP